MTFAEILPHLLAGKTAILGSNPSKCCHYMIRNGKVWTRYPFWDNWMKGRVIHLAAIASTEWNYAPDDSPPTT